MRSIGKNIRDLRTRKNITQEALAEALFVTRQTVSNYETGRSQPDVGMLLKIADALGVDANTLIYGPPKPPSRRAAVIRTAVGGGIFAALCIVALAVGPPEFLWATPGYACHDLRVSLLYPLLLAAAGWVVPQVIAVLLGFEPPKWKFAFIARWVLFAIFAVVLLTLVQYRLANEFPNSFIHTAFFAGVNKLFNALAHVAHPFPWAFFFVGAALWLFGFPRQPAARNDADRR